MPQVTRYHASSGLWKCFIHLCRQMLQMLQFLLRAQAWSRFCARENSSLGEDIKFCGEKICQPHQQIPPKFFSRVSEEKAKQNSQHEKYLGCLETKRISKCPVFKHVNYEKGFKLVKDTFFHPAKTCHPHPGLQVPH